MSSGSGVINHVTVVGAGLMGSGIAQVKIKFRQRSKSGAKSNFSYFHRMVFRWQLKVDIMSR